MLDQTVWEPLSKVKDGMKKANDKIAASYAEELVSCLKEQTLSVPSYLVQTIYIDSTS